MRFAISIVMGVFGFLAFGSLASAQVVNVLVLQEDADPESIERDNRIQQATLISFQKVLHMPTYQRYMQQFGIEGLDVYDETAASMRFYDTTRTRRTDAELIQLARQITNPRIDAMVLYALYARAVEDPFTKIALLQASMQYRVLDVKSGRFLGGDTVDLDRSGIPFTDCAANLNGTPADPHCVKEFVAGYAEQLAEDAANKIALQIGMLLGQAYSGATVVPPAAGGGDDVAVVVPQEPQATNPSCANLPTTYIVTFKGVEQTQMNAIEEYMRSWACAMDFDLVDTSFSSVRYQYKTRASLQRIVRNIRNMGEMMGVMIEPSISGSNEIIIEAFRLRSN